MMGDSCAPAAGKRGAETSSFYRPQARAEGESTIGTKCHRDTRIVRICVCRAERREPPENTPSNGQRAPGKFVDRHSEAGRLGRAAVCRENKGAISAVATSGGRVGRAGGLPRDG